MAVSLVILQTLSIASYADNTGNPKLSAQEITVLKTGESGDYTIVPFADKIVWRYKTMNGKYYRRQYNTTKLEWIGEWELVK